MKVKILFFGILAEKAGIASMYLEGASDIKTLKEKIFTRHPELKNYSFRVSVNKNIVADEEKLRNGDEVALLPPFAGG